MKLWRFKTKKWIFMSDCWAEKCRYWWKTFVAFWSIIAKVFVLKLLRWWIQKCYLWKSAPNRREEQKHYYCSKVFFFFNCVNLLAWNYDWLKQRWCFYKGQDCESKPKHDPGVWNWNFHTREQILNSVNLSEMLGLSSENCGWNLAVFKTPEM